MLTVLFQPFQVHPQHPHSPDAPEDGDDDDDQGDNADDNDDPPGAPTVARAAPLRSSADTGGTSGSSRSHEGYPVPVSVDMWPTVFEHPADHAGKWWLTSVQARAWIRGASSAVCSPVPNVSGGVEEGHAKGWAVHTVLGIPDPHSPWFSGTLLHSIGMCALVFIIDAYSSRRREDTPAGLCDSPTEFAGHRGLDSNKDRHNGSTPNGPDGRALSTAGPHRAPHRRPLGLIWFSWFLWVCSAHPVAAVTQPAGTPSIGRGLGHCPLPFPTGNGENCARPVATPARSRCLPAPLTTAEMPIADDLIVGPLVTLLEQSAAQTGSEAFLLARSLLETLCEHFADRTLSAPSGFKTTLPLSELLPSQVEYDVSCVSLRNPLQLEQVAAFLACAWHLPHDIPTCIDVHPATQQVLAHHIPFAEGCSVGISSISVYTDGSYDGRVSHWAFTAIAHCQYGDFVFAWAKGRVRLAGQEWFIGAPDHSALSAERSAVFWATAWLFGVNRDIACTIHCDCLVAAYQANGKYGDSSASPFAATCRALVQALEARGTFHAASIRHVRGHQGHPYNELADTLAGANRVDDVAPHAVYGHLCRWATEGTLPWLWLSIAALCQPLLWPDFKGHNFADPYGNTTLEKPLSPQAFFGNQISDVHPAKGNKIDFVLAGLFVSVNVQSLCEDDSSRLPNRTPFVREQLKGLGCAVTGLQETRAKQTSTIVSSSHIRFLSGCDSKGCLGVELWFSKTVALGWQGSTPIYFAIEDFRVLHWTPRILIVRYVHGGLRILFVTCHAPTATSPDRDAWWKGFVDLLLQTAKDDKVVVLGDFNARLCDPLPGRVGDLVWEQEHRPPSPFFRMLQALDLWVPSTFHAYHWGLSHTWCAPGGSATSRIDFILIPSSLKVPNGGSSVLYEVDLGQSGLDHFAVQLRMHVTFVAKPVFHVNKKRFDCAKAMQPEAAQTVQAIFDTAPAVPWAVDAHQHYHAVASHVLDGLSRHFPCQTWRASSGFLL